MKLMTSLLFLALSAPALSAQTFEPWGEAGDWNILINADNGNGCFAEKAFDDGTLVQMGFAPLRDGGFFAAFNPAWTGIEDGAAGTVQFDFGDAKFGGDAVGQVLNGVPGGYAFFDNPAFLSEFVKRNSVVVSGGNGGEVTLSLAGTAKAAQSVQACQKEQPDPEAEAPASN